MKLKEFAIFEPKNDLFFEFERYGNRSVASFLRMVGAEMPSNSDLIKWAEQGRLHVKYQSCTSAQGVGADEGTWTIPNNLTNFNPALAGTPNTAASYTFGCDIRRSSHS